MCLDKVEKFEPAKEGYKVFHEFDGKLYSQYQSMGKELIVGKWLDEADYRLSKWTKLKRILRRPDKIWKYEMGFHIFHELDGAKKWKGSLSFLNGQPTKVIMKVLVREPVVTGYQNGYKVTVARKMKILEKVE